MFQDFKFILKKPILFVSLFVIALLPLIYAVTFLGAMWNPYDRTSEMTFSIVNEDKGGEEIKLGEEFVKEIEKNDDLNWEFTDLKTAEEHLQKGESYGYLRIPENASEDAESLLTDDPTQVNLTLKTNPGHNFIGSIMSEQAGDMMVSKISNKMTHTYTKTLFSSLNDLKDNSEEAKDALAQLEKGVTDLDNGLAQLNSGASDLASGESQFTTQLTQLAPLLGNYNEPVTEAQKQLDEGAKQLAGGSSELKTGSSQLKDGIGELNKELDKAFKKMDEVKFTDDGAKYLAYPVKLDVQSSVETQNYAQSFAPLIIAISLFIGSITFNVVYPMNKIFEDAVSPFKQWISRGLLFLTHALLISTFLYIAIVHMMEIEVVSHGRFFLASFMWGLASILLVAVLVMIFGNLGKFFGLVLLIVQLSSSAGTFPIETSNGFYEAMHSFLPMGFVITGFRDAIFGQAFDQPFSTVMYVLLGTIITSYIMVLIIFIIKDRIPKYKEFVQRISKFES